MLCKSAIPLIINFYHEFEEQKIHKISKISQAVPTAIIFTLKCAFKEIWMKTLLEAPSYDHIAPPL